MGVITYAIYPPRVGLPHHMGSFKLRMHQNPFSAGAPPRTPLGSFRRSPRPPSRLGRGHPLPIPLPLDAFGVSISPPSPLLLKEIYANACGSDGMPPIGPFFKQFRHRSLIFNQLNCLLRSPAFPIIGDRPFVIGQTQR